MKNKQIFFISLVCMIFLNGCAFWTNPLKSFEKAQTKVLQTQSQLQNNQDDIIEQSKNYIYGADYTLNLETNPSKYNMVAKQFTERAKNTLGLPDIDEIEDLKITITNLLSDNTKLIIKGENALSQYDLKVSNLQAQNKELQSNLTEKQNILTKIGQENSTLANKWTNLVKWFWWIVYGIIGIFVLRMIAAICPPPYSSIASILAIPFIWIIHLIKGFIPEAISGAKLVTSEYKTATQNLVSAIQDIKTTNPTIHSTISNIVAQNISDSAIPVISEAKANLQIVS